MSITIEEVRYIAKLARLSFSETEEEVLAKDMSRILDYVGTLNQVDTSDVEPMTHVHDQSRALRQDSVDERISHEDALKNAPESDGEHFMVPKVIG
ncbi:MAG: Asp-tRNA(Asn)/Glu-tRNA(Gln) amidotransferase subunit GatC [Bacteroidetes bacterium]|nr:Asp-tRNA(Asn)/Glu-tRNA(Gln) amidotransferase subunit GatC [Bacteroidota bacterium]MCY4224579.1 Asp-tRNA(Asn)/Glu-tRNA(Gln) amidotransferase subunit GatC [Bacteroidota bacterium]